jgi:rod shape determining protein RodA
MTKVAYRMERVVAFLDPRADVVDMGYQINQSLIALGSGGWWGGASAGASRSSGSCPSRTTISSWP